MKDSGIPWVGEIPADWEVGKVKGCLRRHEVKGHGDAMVLALYRDHGVVPKDSRDDNHNRTGKDTNDYKYVREGDLVINKMKAWQGSLSVSGFEGIVSPAYFIYEFVGHNLDRGFADYLLRSTYKQEFERVSGGIREGQWDLPRYDFEHMQLPLPSMEEQQRIADYLDERCAAIDEVRRTIEDEVEALRRLRKATIHKAVTKGLDEGVPMRDSGVEWIGEIPKSWTTIPLKRVCTFGKGLPITKADLVDEGLPVVSYGQIHSRKNTGTTLTDELCRHVEEKWLRTNSSALASRDSFLFADTSEDYEGLGNCAFIDTDDLIFAGYHTIIARPHGYSCPKYLAYLFRTDCWRKQIREKASGVKVFSATQSIFKRVSVLVPSLSEQQRIADYLDERCAAIDSIIDTRTKQLQRLEDYRKALIFAYVTGKKEVPTHA